MGQCLSIIAKPEEAVAKPEEAIAKPEEAVAKPEEAVAKPEEAVTKPEEEKSKDSEILQSYTDMVSLYHTATYENIPEYTLEGLRSYVKILRIVDGDTVDIALYHKGLGHIYRHRIRLYGIDTPEKRPSKSDPLRHLEIEAAYRAKDALDQKIKENDGIVLALFSHPDKYGRLLCTLYDKSGDNINQWMVTQGYATEYFGKTKKKFVGVINEMSTTE